QLRMSAVTLAELRFGVTKSSQPKRSGGNLKLLVGKVGVVPFDDVAAERYGELRTRFVIPDGVFGLERRGAPIGPLDTLIAAHALSLGWTLATHNAREFRRVAGLHVEDWLA